MKHARTPHPYGGRNFFRGLPHAQTKFGANSHNLFFRPNCLHNSEGMQCNSVALYSTFDAIRWCEAKLFARAQLYLLQINHLLFGTKCRYAMPSMTVTVPATSVAEPCYAGGFYCLELEPDFRIFTLYRIYCTVKLSRLMSHDENVFS